MTNCIWKELFVVRRIEQLHHLAQLLQKLMYNWVIAWIRQGVVLNFRLKEVRITIGVNTTAEIELTLSVLNYVE